MGYRPSQSLESHWGKVTTCHIHPEQLTPQLSQHAHLMLLQASLSAFTWEQSAKFEWSCELRIILMMVFWPCVYKQISITKGNLNCAIQIMVRRCFPVTHLSNHAANSRPVWMPWPLNCDFEGGATWPSNHFRRWSLFFTGHIDK